MDYIGSKAKLNDWMFGIIGKAPLNSKMVFLDACSGSGSVSRYAAMLGYRVISNDLMKFPSTIVNGSVGLSRSQIISATKEIKKLNTVKGLEGYFYHNFCDKSIPPRLYFTSENACLIDGIRRDIDKIEDTKVRDYLLYCGIEALSRTSNTAGVQAAYLKEYKDRAKKRFTLQEELVVDGVVVSFNRDILHLLEDVEFRSHYQEDILYIDPPYNQRQYGPNYHLYETFVRNDNPQPRGKTGLRNWKDECCSKFCNKRDCLVFLTNIITASVAKRIFISYSSDGLMDIEELKEAFPDMTIFKMEQRRYKADTSNSRKYNLQNLFEYLCVIKR